MQILRRIINLLKNTFAKKEVKEIGEPSKVLLDDKEKDCFINKLKEKIVTHKSKKVETLECPGDGLGIQIKINS